MKNAERPPGRQAGVHRELPGPKRIMTVEFDDSMGEKTTAWPGLGPKKDIVVIRNMPGEIPPEQTVCTYLFRGRRFLASSGRTHAGTAGDIHLLLMQEGLKSDQDDVERNSTRIKVKAIGPKRTFIIDGERGDSAAEAAARILRDLGVAQDSICYDRDSFIPRV